MPRWLIVAMSMAAGGAAVAQPAPETGHAPVHAGQIQYVVTGPADGEPVLLIHGAMLGTAFELVQEAPALDGYRVIRMHRRGFVGSSDAAPGRSRAADAADAVAVLDALGVERAHVVGHSAGATVALQLAVDAPKRVRTLVLLDPALPGPAGAPLPAPIAAAAKMQAAGDVEGGLQAFAKFVFGDDWHDFFDAVPGGYEQAVADARRLILGRGAAALRLPPFDPAQIAAMDRPTLVLWGEESALGAQAAAFFAATLPRAESGMIKGTDHALITQKPDEVANAIAAFIERHRR